MKKIKTFFVILLVIHLLAVAGLILFLCGTGRLDSQKMQTIVDMLKHKGSPEKLRDQVSDILEPPATAPASQAATQGAIAGAATLPGTAEERMEAAHQIVDQERVELETLKQELRNRRELLERIQTQVDAKMKSLEQAKAAFEKEQTASTSQSASENFQKALALYDGLKPKQVKDIFITLPRETVAAFLQAMDPDRAAKIIAEFKTPEERGVIKDILERIRNPGTSAASDGQATGPTPGT